MHITRLLFVCGITPLLVRDSDANSTMPLLLFAAVAVKELMHVASSRVYDITHLHVHEKQFASSQCKIVMPHSHQPRA